MWCRPLALAPVLLVLGCGGSGERTPPPGERTPAAAELPTARSWCPALEALTTDRRTDLTGRANTLQRVRHVKNRHSRRLARCPGVVGFGIGKKTGGLPADQDHLISIFLVASRHRPRDPLFLDGVPIHFKITGPIRAL